MVEMWRALGSTQIIRLIWPGFPKTILKWNEKASKTKQNDNQLIPGNKPENETARSGNEINRQIITFWQFINELYFVSDVTTAFYLLLVLVSYLNAPRGVTKLVS